jgi:hypothetical protein
MHVTCKIKMKCGFFIIHDVNYLLATVDRFCTDCQKSDESITWDDVVFLYILISFMVMNFLNVLCMSYVAICAGYETCILDYEFHKIQFGNYEPLWTFMVLFCRGQQKNA